LPPYKKPISKAQAGEFAILKKEGKISSADFRGKMKGVDVKNLPKRVKRKKS